MNRDPLCDDAIPFQQALEMLDKPAVTLVQDINNVYCLQVARELSDGDFNLIDAPPTPV